MKVLFDDGIMRAEEVYSGWVLVRWVGEQTKMKFTRIYKDLKKLETHIRLSDLRGWMVASEPEHKKMHRIFERLGATQYGQDDEHLFFRKELNYVFQI